MEILILGLILVAVMVYASTKIKKRAAEAFEPESIETPAYSLQKPEGFLHVIDSPDHDFEAYSREFNEGDFRVRRAKIEVEVFPDSNPQSIAESIAQNARRSEVISESDSILTVEADEEANETRRFVVYKLVSGRNAVYQLRFAVINEHREEYREKINETLESFILKTS